MIAVKNMPSRVDPKDQEREERLFEIIRERKKYSTRIKCTNCGSEGHLEIKIGYLITEILCPRCGCRSLVKG